MSKIKALSLRGLPDHCQAPAQWSTLLRLMVTKLLKRYLNASSGGVAANVTKCGHKRYCHNCQEVFKHLDRGFVEASMADTAIAMTANCVTHWAGRPGQQPLVWGRPTDPGRSHVCKGTCIGI